MSDKIIMQWYDTFEFWPSINSNNILVDGWTSLETLDEFKFEGHRGNIEFGIKFFCLIATVEHCTDDTFELNGAIFYSIDEYFCCDQEDIVHYRRLLSKGCHLGNIDKFVEKDTLNAQWNLIKRWTYLK